MSKKEQSKNDDLLTSIRNLLILQLHSQNVPVLDIIKAAKIRSNDIYKIIPKSKKLKKSKTT